MQPCFHRQAYLVLGLGSGLCGPVPLWVSETGGEYHACPVAAALLSSERIPASSYDSLASAAVAGLGRVLIIQRDSAESTVRLNGRLAGVTVSLSAGSALRPPADRPPVGRGNATPRGRKMGPRHDIYDCKIFGPYSELPETWMFAPRIDLYNANRSRTASIVSTRLGPAKISTYIPIASWVGRMTCRTL